MTQRILERKLRILKAELRMIQTYYDESKELLLEYEQEWLRDFAHFQQKFSNSLSEESNELEPDSRSFSIADALPLGGESSNPNKEMPDPVSKSSAPDWAKKVFRKIAMLIHPDRSSNPEHDSKLFLKVSNSFDSGDYESLLSTAIDLGISLDMDTPVLGALLQKKIDSLKNSVSKLERSVPWLWGESFGLHNIRAPLLKINLAQRGIGVNNEELLVAIQEREKKNETR